MNLVTVRRLGPLSGILAAAMFGVGAALSARGGYFPTALLSPVHYIFEGLAAAWIVAASALIYRQEKASTASLAPVALNRLTEA